MYSTFRYKSSVLSVNNKINYGFLYDVGFAIPSITLKDSILKLRGAKKRVLDYLFYMAPCKNGIYASQAHIGSNAGITREWANKAIKSLVSEGLLDKIYRHRKTCIYRIPEKLFVAKNIKWLALRFSSIYKLLTKAFTPNYKYLNSLNIYNINLQIKSLLGSNMFTQKKNNTEKTYELLESIKNMTLLDEKIKKSMKGLLQCLGVFTLTQHGIIELCVFPNDVLLEALERFNEEDSDLFDDHFMRFINLCEEIAEESDAKVDSFLKHSMMRMYNIRRLRVLIGNKSQAAKLASFLDLNSIVINHKWEGNKQTYNGSSSFRNTQARGISGRYEDYDYDVHGYIEEYIQGGIKNDRLRPENITFEDFSHMAPMFKVYKVKEIESFIKKITGENQVCVDSKFKNYIKGLFYLRDTTLIINSDDEYDVIVKRLEECNKYID